MATGNTELTVDGILKDYYKDGGATNTTYENGNVLWGIMTKKRAMGGVTGRSFIHSVVYADSNGDASGTSGNVGGNNPNNPTAANDFQYSQQAGSTSSFQSVEFHTQRVRNYKDFTISTEAYLSTEGVRGAFESAITLQSDLAVRKMGQRQDIFMFGAGTGALSNVAAATVLTSNVIKLQNANDAVKFTPGQELDVATLASGGAPKPYGSAGHGLIVGSVDKSNGLLYIVVARRSTTACPLNDATNGIPTIAAGDYIFGRTDYNNVMQGLEAWVPYLAPVPGVLFNGVDRAQGDIQALSGSRFDATGKTFEEVVIGMTIRQEFVAEKQMTHIIMPWGFYETGMLSGTARQPVLQGTDLDVSFPGIEVMTPSGTVIVLPARNCPANRVYGIDLESWEYTHVREPIWLWDLDGNTGLRQPGDDGIEYRMASIGNAVCHKPQNNITAAILPRNV